MKEIKNNTRNDILLFWKYLNDEYSTNKNYLSNIIEFAHFQNLLNISWYELLQKYENYIPKIEDTYKHQIGDHVMLIAPSGQPLYTYSSHNYCRFIKGLIKEIHYNDKNELDDDSYIIVQNIENNKLIKFVNVNNRQYYNYYILDNGLGKDPNYKYDYHYPKGYFTFYEKFGALRLIRKILASSERYVWKSCYLDKGNTKTRKEYLMNIVNFLLEKN